MRRVLPRRRVEADVDDEIRTHLELRIEDNLARGLSPEEARREAVTRFGDVDRVRDTCRTLGHEQERAMHRSEVLGALRQDLAYAARMLARAPGFAAVAVLSLALGIGANTAIFGLVDSLVLRPLPGIERPETLVDLQGTSKSYPAFLAIRDELGVFAEVAGYRTRQASVAAGGGEASVMNLGIVSANYFPMLGVRPALGRAFVADEDRRGVRVPVAMVSHGLWQRAFGADSAVLGRTVRLNGAPFTIVGVTPRGFRGTQVLATPDVWIPINAWPLTAVASFTRLEIERASWGWLRVVARVKPGVPVAQAQARLRAFGTEQQAKKLELGSELANARVVAATEVAASTGGSGPGVGDFALLLLGAVGLTLIIACANVAGLLLARASRRHKEIGVRLALGAGRGRLVRQLLTESLFVGLLGAAAGIAVAAVGARVLGSIDLPEGAAVALTDGGLTTRMLGVALALTVGSVLIFGLVPALQASRPELVATLREAGQPRGARARLRHALVVAQLALSLVLLAGTGLFLRSVRAALSADLGYRTDGVAAAQIDAGLQRYSDARAELFHRALGERVARRPGVTAVGFARTLPLTENEDQFGFRVPSPAVDTLVVASLSANVVGGDFFRAVGLPLVRGRGIAASDGPGAPAVAVINETMARRYWPAGNALGARIVLSGTPSTDVTIVGIARDAKYIGLDDRPEPHVYLSLHQQPGGFANPVTVVARTTGDAAALAAAVRAESRALDPSVPVLFAARYDDVVGNLVRPQRIAATLFGVLGTLTLALAMVGVYGVMAYLVAQRTREIGIRMALGASRGRVLALVLGRSGMLVGLGLVVGLALALAASRVVASFVVGIAATDPLAFAGSAAVLAAAALLASWIPARRATRIAPTVALRAE